MMLLVSVCECLVLKQTETNQSIKIFLSPRDCQYKKGVHVQSQQYNFLYYHSP